LTVDNSGSSSDNIVTLTTNNTETKTLNLTQGYFAAGTNQTLKISNTGTVNGTGGGDCVYLTADGGNIHLLGNNAVTGASSGHPYFYDVTIGSGIAVSPSTFTNNGTIYHHCTINSEGSVNPNAPTYATGSTLIYNPGGTYNRNIEWGNIAGLPGYPWHVRVQNSTTLNLGTNAVSPAELELGGDLYIGTSTSGSNLVKLNALAKPLTVKGDLYIGDAVTSPTANELQLSTVYGGDLWLYGNFTRYTNNNYYTDNSRAIFFKGTGNSIIVTPSASAQNFSYALADKSTGTETINLQTPVGITQMMTFTKGIVHSDASNLLTIQNTAVGAVSGGSSLSFVDGPMKRYTSTSAAGAYAFPLGKTGSPNRYKPLTLTTVNNIASASQFTGEYFYTNPPNAGNDVFLNNLTGIISNEYWQLDRNAGTTTGKITIPYTNPGAGLWRDAGGLGVSPCSGCYVGVVKRSSSLGAGNWDFTAATSTLSSSGAPPELMLYTNSGDIISKEVSSFSPFTAGFYYDVILPVQLLEFKGRLTGGDAVLDWKVADIRDLASFELQHSTDGRLFTRLATTPNDGSLAHTYTDKSLKAGAHFYRLLMLDKSGEKTYSQVILLSLEKPQTRIIGLLQNPVKSQLQVQVAASESQESRAELLDIQGRVLGRYQTLLSTGFNLWKIPASYLSPGVYWLRLQTGNRVAETLRFVKE
jgi:hypothetical protein